MSTNYPDRRVQRTRRQLHGALASLIHEKPYDEIVVKEILARANVGRSTFYSHFRDKDDLLARSIRDVLDEERVRSPGGRHLADRVLDRTLHLFEHVENQVLAGKAPMATAGQPAVHEHLHDELVRSIIEDGAYGAGEQREETQVVPHELIARFVASTFLVVLEWWLEADRSRTAREANELLTALVLPALAGIG